MSDHPEVPRFTFNDDGESLNLEEAVAKFRRQLESVSALVAKHGVIEHAVIIEARPCDCESSLSGHDPYCPLHGDRS